MLNLKDNHHCLEHNNFPEIPSSTIRRRGYNCMPFKGGFKRDKKKKKKKKRKKWEKNTRIKSLGRERWKRAREDSMKVSARGREEEKKKFREGGRVERRMQGLKEWESVSETARGGDVGEISLEE
jgi:hypothetical protein